MDTLRLYYDVARHRSLSQAAALHGITQSAVSQRIGQLERKLGVILLDRSIRPLALTPAGEKFTEGCRELLERYDRLLQQVAKVGQELEGTVRVDAIYSAGIDLLNQMKEGFEQINPGVKVVVEYKQPEMVYAAVREGQCDLGILSYPQRWPEVGVIALRNEPMAVVCSPGHPLAGRGKIHARELDGYSMVGFENDLPVARRIRAYLREHGAKVKVTSAFDNVDSIKNAVAVTGDLAILPERTVAREVTALTLAVVEIRPALVRPLGMIYRRNRTESNGMAGHSPFTAVVQAFIDHLLEYAGPGVNLTRKIMRGNRGVAGAQS